MSTTSIADRYQRLADAFGAKIAAVPPDRWEAPTPCEGWRVRDLVGHVVQTHELFSGFVGRTLGDIPSVDEDPVGAFDAARAVVLDSLRDPQVASTEYQGLFGRTTFAEGVDFFVSFDLVIHGWDLARAVGLDERIDPGEVERLFEQARAFGDAARAPGAFGPALEPPPGADEQTRLLAFLGRSV
jgi:uncharacterized protein (TIGR03086 family)